MCLRPGVAAHRVLIIRSTCRPPLRPPSPPLLADGEACDNDILAGLFQEEGLLGLAHAFIVVKECDSISSLNMQASDFRSCIELAKVARRLASIPHSLPTDPGHLATLGGDRMPLSFTGGGCGWWSY